MLPHTLLHPITYQVQDPFASIVECMEGWLLEHQPDYLIKKWPTVKYDYLKRLLGLAKNGSALRGHSQTAPTHALSSALLDIYHLLDHCVYFTSRYWRAFFYWLKTGELNTSWPQFGQREVAIACSLLSQEDIEKLKIEASKEWVDLFDDKNAVALLFKTIKKPVHNLCYKRVSFLDKYDHALYSFSDLQQHVYESILVSLRNNDYFTTKPSKMVGWALKCADNAIHNLRDMALSDKRSRVMEIDNRVNTDLMFGGKLFAHRECHLSMPIYTQSDEDVDCTPKHTWIDSILLLGDRPFHLVDNMEDTICLNELLSVADPKINTYLRVICGGEHSPDFWSWFYYNEPTLAQRVAYVEENPEAIGPYLQRHLDLPTYKLTGFLRQHLPDLLSKVSNTPRNRAMLAYA